MGYLPGDSGYTKRDQDPYAKKKPSISRLPCERCGGPVESDNGWFGRRVAYPRGGAAIPLKVTRYALCWKCASPDKEVEDG